MIRFLFVIFLLFSFNGYCGAYDSSPDRKYGKKKFSDHLGGAIGNFSSKTSPKNKNRYSNKRPYRTKIFNSRDVKVTRKNEVDKSLATIRYDNRGEFSKYHRQAPVLGHLDDLDTIIEDGRYVGYYKVGRPYKIDGITYYPQEYDNYTEVGEASWYGKDFDGKMTANGEIYDLSHMTAAHRTLPIPSIVKVTNLQNSKSVIVRVNDRGPFAKNRIIDMSKRAATILDYKDKGVIMVKVELLKEETRKLQDKLKIN